MQTTKKAKVSFLMCRWLFTFIFSCIINFILTGRQKKNDFQANETNKHYFNNISLPDSSSSTLLQQFEIVQFSDWFLDNYEVFRADQIQVAKVRKMNEY